MRARLGLQPGPFFAQLLGRLAADLPLLRVADVHAPGGLGVCLGAAARRKAPTRFGADHNGKPHADLHASAGVPVLGGRGRPRERRAVLGRGTRLFGVLDVQQHVDLVDHFQLQSRQIRDHRAEDGVIQLLVVRAPVAVGVGHDR